MATLGQSATDGASGQRRAKRLSAVTEGYHHVQNLRGARMFFRLTCVRYKAAKCLLMTIRAAAVEEGAAQKSIS
jgi:hypothetical protein